MTDITPTNGAPCRPAAPVAAVKSPRSPGSGDFGKVKIAILFALLMAVVSVPILLNPLPPISDYINHLARMHVIATISSDPYLHRYYEIDWQVIPNLMMDVIVPQFERVMNIYLAGQVYTLLSFALILSGAVALHRRLFGHWSPVPLAAAPLLYNRVFLVGTMNYVFGMGLVLWALVAWIALRERGRALRLSVSLGFVLGLFFCHLFALGVYGVALLAFETHRLWASYAQARRAAGPYAARRALPLLLLDFVATGLPFLPVPVLLLVSPTRTLWDYYWKLHGKISGVSYVVEVYSHEIAFLLTVAVAAGIGWALHRRVLSFHPLGPMLLLVGGIAYLALPRVIFQTYMVDQRLPIALAYILVACIDVELPSRSARWAFTTGLVVLLGIRVGEVESNWQRLSATTDSFRKSVQLLDRGAKVLVAYDDPDGGDDIGDYGLVHADCIALIERSALVTTAFTVVGKQVMHARAAYRGRVDTHDGTPPVVGQLVHAADRDDNNADDYWRHWTSDYNYLYVLFTDSHSENPDPAHLTKLYAGDRFTLYRIVRSQVAAAGRPLK